MSAESLLRMTAPLRPDFAIPYHDIGERDRPPRLALVGGLHGNELNGVFVLSRLASFLRKVALGQQPGQSLVERVLVVPAVNVLGVNTGNRRWPFDGTDINRMFPGYDRGETTQRIAGAVLELTRAAHYRVDVHASNLEFEELPQVRLYAPSAAERASAVLFGLASARASR
jgi:predicted deacylase